MPSVTIYQMNGRKDTIRLRKGSVRQGTLPAESATDPERRWYFVFEPRGKRLVRCPGEKEY